jgi:UDP-N-acetylmuramyl pentapeptide phosphotransferase/UDP-N-acetylglucosamine-1-phosphate transferase
MRMSFLKFYLILTGLGILIDILVIILCNSNASNEQILICLIVAVLFLVIGLTGSIRKIIENLE